MQGNFYQALDLDLAENQRDLLLLSQQLNGRMPEINFLAALMVMGQSGKEKNPKTLTWYNETRQDLFGSVGVGGIDAVVLTIPVDATFVQIVKPRYVINIEGEQMVVESVDTVAKTITVYARGDAGTAAAAHAAAERIDITGKAEADGVITSDFTLSGRVSYENFRQEFTETIEVTTRAEEGANKDREDLLEEERLAVLRKQLQLLNKALRMSYGKYDTTSGGMHTMNGYKAMIENNGGVTQATLGYVNGAFDYDDWKELMFQMSARSSNVSIIHTNAQTKQKLIELIPDKDYKKDITANEANKAGIFYDGIVAAEWDGRILYFLVDNSINGDYFALLDMNSMGLTPWKAIDGSDKMYVISQEVEDSSRVKETLRSQCTLKIHYPDMMAVCENI